VVKSLALLFGGVLPVGRAYQLVAFAAGGGKGDEAGGGVGLVAAVLEVFRVVGEVVVVGGRGWWFGVRGHPAVEVVAGGRESIVLFLRLGFASGSLLASPPCFSKGVCCTFCQ